MALSCYRERVDAAMDATALTVARVSWRVPLNHPWGKPIPADIVCYGYQISYKQKGQNDLVRSEICCARSRFLKEYCLRWLMKERGLRKKATRKQVMYEMADSGSCE